MTKYLVSDKTGDHLPYTDGAGTPDHRLMGAAWAALHGGYRGNKYEGPSKDAAISKLTGVYKAEKVDTPQESAGNFAEVGLTEAYDAKTGELSVTVIKPGFNKSKGRFYPASVLKRDYGIFEGAKMFADHQTEAEAKARPEGSVRDWVGSLKSVSVEADGTIKGKAIIVDPVFQAKMARLAETNMLPQMGISIRASGLADRKTVEGVPTMHVEALKHSRSVDFVTFAGAGGQVEAIECDAVGLELLRESVEYVITQKGTTTMTEAEIQKLQADLATANANLQTVNTEKAALETKVNESAKAARIATVQTEVEKQLTEAKLPKPVADRVREEFKAQESVETLPAAIKRETDYAKAIAGVKVLNLGEGHGGGDQGDKDKKADFSLLGLSEAEAKIANAGR